MTTFRSRDVEAAGELALARLDDDGAPPPVTWPSHCRPLWRLMPIPPANTSPGTTEEPIVAVGGDEACDEALQVEHYPAR